MEIFWQKLNFRVEKFRLCRKKRNVAESGSRDPMLFGPPGSGIRDDKNPDPRSGDKHPGSYF
jgi:hypothetical protein